MPQSPSFLKVAQLVILVVVLFGAPSHKVKNRKVKFKSLALSTTDNIGAAAASLPGPKEQSTSQGMHHHRCIHF